MKRPRGISLLEVLISLLVLAFGVLGLLRLQTELLHSQIAANDYNAATNLAQAALEQQHAGTPSLCASSDYRPQDSAIAGVLPRFDCRTRLSGGQASVSVRWQDSQGDSHQLTLEAPQQLDAR